MAATTTISTARLHLVTSTTPRTPPHLNAPRRISPRAGRALELLTHAIEYLTDQYIWTSGAFSASDPDVQAIQLLMALNREIYFACPVMPTVSERLRAFFAPRTA